MISTRTKIKRLFPLKAVITQDIIDKWKNTPTRDNMESFYKGCIGELALRKALREYLKNIDTNWAITHGFIYFDDRTPILKLTTIGGLNMPDITEPQRVTFILSKETI